jgi:hypothetical protein
MSRKYENRYKLAKWLGKRFANRVKNGQNYVEIKTNKNIFASDHEAVKECFRKIFLQEYKKELGTVDNFNDCNDAKIYQDCSYMNGTYTNVFLTSSFDLPTNMRSRLDKYVREQMQINIYVNDLAVRRNLCPEYFEDTQNA